MSSSVVASRQLQSFGGRYAIAALVACTIWHEPTLAAPRVTRIASSVEADDPFGLFFDVEFERTQKRGTIVREWHQNGAIEDVRELNYLATDSRLNLDAHVGLFRDLEMHVGIPVVLAADRSWTFAKGTSAANSTIYQNCLTASGALLDTASCPNPGAGRGVLFPVDSTSQTFRGGLGDLTAGLAWAPFNQRKDDTKPTWVIGVDYTIPTSPTLDPTVATSVSKRGLIGERVHRLTAFTAFSKKMGGVEPYLRLSHSAPLAWPLAYSNCDSATADRLGRPENCALADWNRWQSGARPAHVTTGTIGSEFVAYENLPLFLRLAFDASGTVSYRSASRGYNELSDMMKKILATSDSLQMQGQLAITGQASAFLSLSALISYAYVTDTWLTGESLGRDLNGNSTVDVTNAPNELNPNYDARVDATGRRFRLTETQVLRFAVQLTLMF